VRTAKPAAARLPVHVDPRVLDRPEARGAAIALAIAAAGALALVFPLRRGLLR